MNNRLSFCPRCGEASLKFLNNTFWSCSQCGFKMFFNVAAACGALLQREDKWLFTRRAKEPASSLLCLPGGFVDPGENLEDALKREIREEIGITAGSLEYIASFPNRYLYREIEYRTCDAYFTGQLEEKPQQIDSGEISEVVFLEREEIRLEEIAFPSLKKFLKYFLNL